MGLYVTSNRLVHKNALAVFRNIKWTNVDRRFPAWLLLSIHLLWF